MLNKDLLRKNVNSCQTSKALLEHVAPSCKKFRYFDIKSVFQRQDAGTGRCFAAADGLGSEGYRCGRNLGRTTWALGLLRRLKDAARPRARARASPNGEENHPGD